MRRSIFCLLLVSAAAWAHHSFDAEYDSSRIVKLSGIVTQVEWQNPHAFVFANVKDESGAVKNMRFELGPPYALIRGGWKRDTVKVGDAITVEGGAMAKDPKNNWIGALNQTTMVLPDGKRLTMR